MSEIHGLLLVDKPVGPTSHDVVAKLRRILKMRAIGHTGTLDPFASGLMVCVLGEATKLSQYIVEGEKEYQAVVRLGQVTDTWDSEGQLLSEHSIQDLNVAKITDECLRLVGKLPLRVPDYAAVKVGGKKLYEFARENLPVPEITRTMSFLAVKIESIIGSDVTLTLRCGKGAYIRSWGMELGRRLGVGAHVFSLRRLEVAPYRIEDAATLEMLSENLELRGAFIELRNVLTTWPQVTVGGESLRLAQNGQISHKLDMELLGLKLTPMEFGGIRVCDERQNLVAILESNTHAFRLARVFNTMKNEISLLS